MKRLILIRHAKSDLNQPLVSDHDRILNETGINQAKLIGQYLYKNNDQFIFMATAKGTVKKTKLRLSLDKEA